jgi:serine/threonine protein kinase
MILGTFQYMSPEQVEGKDADARSDVFALGAVLYEMASGKRAFDGKTTASVIAASQPSSRCLHRHSTASSNLSGQRS